MWTRYLPLVLIVASAATYHSVQKVASKAANPLLVIAAAYFVAFWATLLAAAPWRKPALLLETVRSLAPTTIVLLALACVGVEVGVLFAYRAGWKVSQLSAHTTVGGMLALALIGFAVFREQVSVTSVIGLAVACAGLALMNYR